MAVSQHVLMKQLSHLENCLSMLYFHTLSNDFSDGTTCTCEPLRIVFIPIRLYSSRVASPFTSFHVKSIPKSLFLSHCFIAYHHLSFHILYVNFSLYKFCFTHQCMFLTSSSPTFSFIIFLNIPSLI